MNTTVSMSNAIVCLEALLDANTPVMLHGPPGVGKTEVVKQLAAKKGIPLIDWRANLRDPVDARGLPVPNMKNRTTDWLRPSELPIVGSKHPDEGILLLDEINTASPSMMNVCLQIVLEKRVGEHEFKPGWKIVATGNRVKDKAIVGRMSSALKNRFAHLEIEPDVEGWTSYAMTVPEVINNPMAAYLVAFIRFRPEFLHRMPIDDTVNAYPTPRQWFEAMKFLNHPKAIRPMLVGSLVGNDIAVELEGFLRIVDQLPTLAEVVANPKTAKLPSGPSAKYAVVGMLARGATPKNFAAILEYAKRINTNGIPDKEFYLLVGLDAAKLSPTVVNTSAYGKWALENQSVII